MRGLQVSGGLFCSLESVRFRSVLTLWQVALGGTQGFLDVGTQFSPEGFSLQPR